MKFIAVMFFITSISLFALSCEKDDLAGTHWKTAKMYAEDGEMGGLGVRFAESTVYVYGWQEVNGRVSEVPQGTYPYTYTAPNGTIDLGYGEIVTFNVNGNTMVLYSPEGNYVFTRQ